MRVGNGITTSWRARLSRSATRGLLWWSTSLEPELFILFSCSFNFQAVCNLRWDCVLSRTISYFMLFYCLSEVWCLWKRLELWVNQCSEMPPPLREAVLCLPVLLSFMPTATSLPEHVYSFCWISSAARIYCGLKSGRSELREEKQFESNTCS